MADSPQIIFEKLKTFFSESISRLDTISNSSQLVLYAEHILKEGYIDLALECIELYLSMDVPNNQFYIRAHICKGLCLSHEEGKEHESLRYFSKAITLAKKSPCYHFLVYNTSVCLYKVIREWTPSLYSTTLQTVVKGLEEIGSTDYNWRLTLIMCLIQSQLTQFEEAIKTARGAIELVRTHLPSLLVQTYRQLVGWGLLNEVKERDTKTHPQLNILIKLWRIKNSSSTDFQSHLNKLRLLAVNGDSAGKKTTSPLSGGVLQEVLLEIGEISLQYSTSIVNECMKELTDLPSIELQIRKQLLQEQFTIQSLTGDIYNATNVQLRRCGLLKIGDLLNECVKYELNGSLIEETCINIWNMSLPLLQPSLRDSLLLPLTAVSNALKNIKSLLKGLRIMVHMELVKINSDLGHIETSLQHVALARSLDSEGSFCESLKWFEYRLNLRNNIYQTPTDPVNHAVQLLEQLKSSDVCTTAEDSQPLLISIGDLLTNYTFSRLLNTTLTEEVTAKCDRMTLFKDTVAVSNDEYDRTRCWVWSEVATISRKVGLWDICHLSCLYCLKYDDQRWQYTPTHQITSKKSRDSKRGKVGSSHSMTTPERIVSTHSITSLLPYSLPIPVPLQKELLIILGTVHCIYAEVLVHTLQCEGLRLGQTPTDTRDISTDNEGWINYCNWINELTDEAHKSFLRSAQIGHSLQEVWLIYNSGVYLWNYHRGSTTQRDQVTVFKAIYDLLQANNQDNSSVLITHIGTALAGGLVAKWTPPPSPRTPATSAAAGGKNKQKQQGGRASSKGGKKKDTSGGMDQEATNDLKEALNVCETLFSQFGKGLSLDVSYPLLKIWVFIKFLLQSPITNLIPYETEDGLSTKAIVSVEMYSIQCRYSNYEFPNCPTLEEVEEMISSSTWSSNDSLPLELYVMTANCGYIYQKKDVVIKCCQKALELKGDSILLSTVSCLLGQKTSEVGVALNCFKDSARYASEGGSYIKVIQACQYAWNISLSLITSVQGRSLVSGVYRDMITDVMKLAGRRVQGSSVMSNEDVKLLIDMYTIILTGYIDKNEWAEGLEFIESAMWVCPKSLHLPLMKYKILFKCHMGVSVEGEVLRYQEEVEPNVLGEVWFEIGSHSLNKEYQKKCFDKAIELSSADSKLHYIIELSCWLYRHGYPHDEVLNQLKLAVVLCSTHSINNLDTLSQLYVMMYHCTGNVEYCMKAVGCVLLIMKGMVNYGSMEEWVGLSLSDEYISQIQDGTNEAIPSVKNILKPLLTVHYMESLVDALTLYSLHLLTLPVLQYQSLIAKHIINSQPLNQLILLRIGVICQQLKLSGGPSLNYTLSPIDISLARCTLTTHTTATSKDNDKDSALGEVIGDTVNVARLWTDIAYILLGQGKYQTAGELLTEARTLCQMSSDDVTLGRVLLGEVKLLINEKKYNQAIETLSQLQSVATDYTVWLEMIDCYCTVISNRDQLKAVLVKGLESIGTVMRGHLLSLLSAVLNLKLILLKKEEERDKNKIHQYIDVLVQYGHSSIAISILDSLAEDSGYILQSIQWARHSVMLIKELLNKAIQITKPNTGVVLPAQRLLVRAQLKLAKLLFSVATETVGKRNKQKEGVSQKSSIEKMIDDYVYEAPILSTNEEQWEETQRLAASEGLSLINNCYNLINDPSIQGQCLFIGGSFLLETSSGCGPDVLDTWLPWLPGSKDDNEGSMSSLSMIMRQQESDNAQVMERLSVSGLANGVECLLTSISKGLKTQELCVVQECSLRLVNVFGCIDSFMSSSLLALYQSCTVSIELCDLLMKCLPLPEESGLSALLHQYHTLRDLPTVETSRALLQQNYECWRRLKVNVNHFELLKSFHCDMRFIILQSSLDGSSLYCGYLVPPQPPPPAPKKGQPPIDYEPLVPVAGWSPVIAKDLFALKQLMKEYSTCCQGGQMDYDMLQVQFDGIVTGLEAYLSGCISILTPTLEKEDREKELNVVLLLDSELLCFPVEALSFLQRKNIKTVVRDFSLQLFYHRQKGMITGDEEGSSEDDKKKSSSSDKYQPQPSSFLANTPNFKYILDPRNDLGGSQEIKSVISEYPKLASKWSGHCGTDHALSHGEWSPLLTNSSGLIVMCSEKFLNHFPPHYLPSLNLSGTSFALIMDLLSSTDSFKTQSKLDLYKNNEEKALEDTLVLVKLLSLVGVNAIYCHQWRDTVSNGINRLKTLIKDMLSKPLCSGQLLVCKGEEEMDKHYETFNGVIYGLPHITFVPETT